MKKTIKDYLNEEKGVEAETVDDTEQSPEVPSTISSALMRRLGAGEELRRLNELARFMISLANPS